MSEDDAINSLIKWLEGLNHKSGRHLEAAATLKAMAIERRENEGVIRVWRRRTQEAERQLAKFMENQDMVENQHQKITGYRDLSEEEISLMNLIKEYEKQLAAIHQQVVALLPVRGEAARQANIARTEFEHAFMRLVRAVAQPASPWDAPQHGG